MEDNITPQNKRTVLIVTSSTAFFTTFMWSAVNVALPTIGADLKLNAVQLGWVLTIYLFASAALVLPFGRLADIYGRKRLFVYGIIGFTVSTFIAAFANSGPFLIAFRVFQGVAGAMFYSTGPAIISSVFQPGERGRALGINAAVIYTGLTTGPFIGGVLTEHLGWRSVFFAITLFSLMALVLVLLKLKGDWVDAKGEKFDIIGSVIFTFTLLALIYGFSLLPDITGIWIVLIGILGMAAFVRHEIRTKSPILNIDLFRYNRKFAFSSLGVLINFLAMISISFLINLYLQYIKGFSPQDAGLLLLIQPCVQMLCSPISGRISDKVRHHYITSVGMALTAVGPILYIFLSGDTSTIYILAGLIVSGFGLAFFITPNTNSIMSSVDSKYYGIASAMVATMRHVGIVLGMAVIMMMFSIYMGRVQVTPEYYGVFLESLRTIFIVVSAICFIGIFISFASGSKNNAVTGNNGSESDYSSSMTV